MLFFYAATDFFRFGKEAHPMVEIMICMGSSCFARGNKKNLAVIQDYLKRHGLEASVKLRGDLCHGNCKEGPNLVIDGVSYTQVDSNTCIDLLNKHFKVKS